MSKRTKGRSRWAWISNLGIQNAALVNGTMAHVLDYDDVSTNTGGYPYLCTYPRYYFFHNGSWRGAESARPDIIHSAYLLGYEKHRNWLMLSVPNMVTIWVGIPPPHWSTLPRAQQPRSFSNLSILQTVSALGMVLPSSWIATGTLAHGDKSFHIAERAMVYVLDGKVKVIIVASHLISKRRRDILPANQPHALEAVTRFKMMLTMIRLNAIRESSKIIHNVQSGTSLARLSRVGPSTMLTLTTKRQHRFFAYICTPSMMCRGHIVKRGETSWG